MKSGFLHPRLRNFAFGMILTAQAGLAANYTLTADAGKTLGAYPRFWQEGVGSCHIYMTLNSAQGLNFKDHYALAATELGMKRIRAHGILNDDVGIYKETNGAAVYDWKNLDAIMDYLVSIDMEPVVEMSFMPKALASGTQTFGWYGGVPGNITPPKDWNKWRELCYQFAKHLSDRYGAAKVAAWHFEIWNEPDLTIFWTGSKEDYFRLYDYAVDGILKANPDAKVGGPSIAISGGSWIDDFLEHCMTRNYADASKTTTKVDFVTWHTYPTNSGQASIAGSATGVTAKINAKKAKYPALAKVKNFLTEYNTSYKGGDTYNNEIGASFVAKVAHGLFPDQNNGVAPPDMTAFWVISDIWEEWDIRSSLAFNPMGMILRKNNTRKPTYLAFQMMNMMSGDLVSISGGTKAEPGLNGWATVDKAAGLMHILIYDHNRGDGNDIPQAYLDKVSLSVSNIPLGTGKFKVERYAVDRNQANSFRIWEKGGKPAFPSEALWTEMSNAAKLAPRTDGFKATQSGSGLALEFDQYQPGVTLFVVTGEGTTRIGSGPAGSRQGILSARFQVAQEGVIVSGLSTEVNSVEFLDLRGKTLQVLKAGSREVHWDRKDAFGRKVPAGTLIAAFDAKSGRSMRRFHLVD